MPRDLKCVLVLFCWLLVVSQVVLCSLNIGRIEDGKKFSPNEVSMINRLASPVVMNQRSVFLHTFDSSPRPLNRKRVRSDEMEEEFSEEISVLSPRCKRSIEANNDDDLEVCFLTHKEEAVSCEGPAVKSAKPTPLIEENKEGEEDIEEKEDENENSGILRDLPLSFRSESTRFWDAGAVARAYDASRSAGVTPTSALSSPIGFGRVSRTEYEQHYSVERALLLNEMMVPLPIFINQDTNSGAADLTEVEADSYDPELQGIFDEFDGFGFYDVENEELIGVTPLER